MNELADCGTPLKGAPRFSIHAALRRPVNYESDALTALQHSLRPRSRLSFALAPARHGLLARQPHESAADHRVHQIAGSGCRWPHRGRHRFDQNPQREPGRRNRTSARPLLRVSVQVRRGFVESAIADLAQTRQRVPRRAARPRRTVSLLRKGHQATHHRARAGGVRDLSRAPVTEISPPSYAAPASARSRHGVAQSRSSWRATSILSGASTRSICS